MGSFENNWTFKHGTIFSSISFFENPLVANNNFEVEKSPLFTAPTLGEKQRSFEF
ncbi:hypothetical protein N9K77_00425 [bacterium]|nr:hypothetical protein [bacterium]